MPQKSAGIILYRFLNNILEVLIVHPGGPFWAKKDEGAWSIPKGEFDDNENPLEAAIREFEEEMGQKVSGSFLPLSPVKLKSGKLIYPFALEHDFDVTQLKSNTFTTEWPPKSGKMQEFPEIDRGAWVNISVGKLKLNPGQVPILEELEIKIVRSNTEAKFRTQ